MSNEDENSRTPQVAKPSPNLKSRSPDDIRNGGGGGSNDVNSVPPKNVQSGEEFISAVAAKIAAQPLQFSDPDVWGVLTAISEKARKRNKVCLLEMFDFFKIFIFIS